MFPMRKIFHKLLTAIAAAILGAAIVWFASWIAIRLIFGL